VNWRAAFEGAESLGAYESALYTDAHVTGEALSDVGPCRLYNPIDTASMRGRRLGVGVVLRVEHYLALSVATPEDMARTSTDHYVGTDSASDQIACLLTLILGARFRSGGEIRTFDADDPGRRGRARFVMRDAQVLTVDGYRTVIPSASGRTVLLDDAVPTLATLPDVEANTATQVLRAARLFRQARSGSPMTTPSLHGCRS
jgi:hypothetical protein